MDNMSDIWDSSPFVINKSPYSEVPQEARGLADLLYDSAPTGKIYWNGNYNSAGVICDLLNGPVESVTARLLAPWLAQHTVASSVLIFHTKNQADFQDDQPCYLADVTHNVRILTSPRSSKLPQVYGIKAQSLRLHQEDIDLRHILALCTPPLNMNGGERILTTVQYILSQLDAPFNLQRFIELVDEEKWTEEGATFMALRQTLLTALISAEEDMLFDEFRTVLVDLTDLVLSSTGMDAVLIDIVVRQFLKSRPARGMIVFDSCQEYIRINSVLTKTLESSLRGRSALPVSMLFSTTDPASLPPTLLQRMDFVVSGDMPSPEWKRLLGEYFLKETRQLGYDYSSEQMMLLPPNSKAVWAKKVDRHNPDFAYFIDPICISWNDIPSSSLSIVREPSVLSEERSIEAKRSMEVKDIEKEPPERWDMSTPGQAKSVFLEEVDIVRSPLSNLKASSPLHRIPPNTPPKNPFMSYLSGSASTTIPTSEMEPVYPAGAWSAWGQTSDSVNEGSTTSVASIKVVRPSQYPIKYRSLVEAILEASERKCGVAVGVGRVGEYYSRRVVVDDDWWRRYTSLISSGSEANILMDSESDLEIEPSVRLITLNAPREEWLESDSKNKGIPNPLITSDLFPSKYKVVVEAILKLSGNQYGYYVDSQLVSTNCGNKKTNLNPWGWKDAKEAVDGALADGHILQLLRGPTRWIALKGSIEGLKSLRKKTSGIAATLSERNILKAQPMVAPVLAEPEWRSYMPLCVILVALQRKQQTPPFPISSVNAEIKHHFPYTIGSNGYQNILEYIQAAQEVGLVEMKFGEVQLIRKLVDD